LASLIEKRRSLHRSVQKRQDENLHLKNQLCQLQPLANIGSASSMIAHEINNLLTPLGTYADLALLHLDDMGLVEKALRKAVVNCRRISQVMESVLALASGKEQRREDCSVEGLIEEVFTCLCRDFSKDAITVKIDIPKDLTIHIVPVQIQQVIMNLILNAREAMLEHGGTLTLSAARIGSQVRISVSDTGHGIPPEDLERIFSTFYSTKDSRESATECCGTGLGLAFCKTVVEAHQGDLTVESQPGQGTSFHLTLNEASVATT
jgi:signal transduction histidine kinase